MYITSIRDTLHIQMYPYSNINLHSDMATCTCNPQSFNCFFTQELLLLLSCGELFVLLALLHPSIKILVQEVLLEPLITRKHQPGVTKGPIVLLTVLTHILSYQGLIDLPKAGRGAYSCGDGEMLSLLAYCMPFSGLISSWSYICIAV